jgi:hypothetical protein
MQVNHIIVQAGGRGTRLEHLTANKPKALVPVQNLPLLFHLFRLFPDKRFVIVADHKKEVLRAYLECFADVKHLVVDAEGAGTCAGLGRAADLLPDGEPFMLIWSDLMLPEGFAPPETPGDHIGLSETFYCRWRYRDGLFSEERSEEHGVAGLFVFVDRSRLAGIPESGEFVRWLKERGMKFVPFGLGGTKELGLLSEYEKLGRDKTRPFNKLTVEGDTVVKEPVDEQGGKLAEREIKWYEHALKLGVTAIPKIHGVNPLKMERIEGKNVYEYTDLTFCEKTAILRKLTDGLKNLHGLEKVAADAFSVREAYYGKTMERLRKIRDLIPFADRKTITVNGRACRNVFFYGRDFENLLYRVKCDAFAFIHGDCTFSNIMLKDDGEPMFIDPRGYFGHTELYGDSNYDWAKLYYSIVGNYDRFNLKDFRLAIGENSVELKIESNNWEDTEHEFFRLSGADAQTIKLLHAVIWLSLTTYAWQDYDSVCGAFYNGLSYLEELL